MNNIFPNLQRMNRPFKGLNPMKYPNPRIIKNYSKPKTGVHATMRGLSTYRSKPVKRGGRRVTVRHR